MRVQFGFYGEVHGTIMDSDQFPLARGCCPAKKATLSDETDRHVLEMSRTVVLGG